MQEGYVVDSGGKIRGEVRRYNPYARLGEIMLYEIDSFGFVYSYISGNYCVMSEEDILADRHLAKRLREVKYQCWKRKNILELTEQYEKENPAYKDDLERFCREKFDRIFVR